MQLDSEKSISLPDIQIYAAELMGWHPLLNLTSSWIHMKRTFSFSSVADAVTVSRDLYGKAYPQPFVIRIFFPFILRYARFSGKNMRIKIILDRRCGQVHLHHPAIPDLRIQ